MTKRLRHVVAAALATASILTVAPAAAAFFTSRSNEGNTLTTASAYGYADQVRLDLPFLYYRLNELSGPTVTDSSGNGRHGTVSGTASPTWYAGTIGALTNDTDTAFTSSGSNSAAISTPAPPVAGPTSLTISVWLRTTTTTGGRLVGFGLNPSGSNATQDRQLYMAPNGTLVFGVYNSASASVRTVQTTTAYNDGAWHHVVAVLDAADPTSGMRIYVDGTQRIAGAYATPEAYTGHWRVGWDAVPANWTATPGGTTFNGAMDEVAVYHSALPATRVSAQYGSHPVIKTYRETVSADRPYAWYRLAEGTGATTAVDSSGQGRSGSYVGGVTLQSADALPGETNAAVSLDGSTGYVSGAAQNNPTVFTVEAWFRTTVPRGRIIGFGNAVTGVSTQRDRHVYMRTDGRLTFGVYPGAFRSITSPGRYDDGRWHHVAASLTAAPGSNVGMRLYMDGVEVAGDPATTTAESYDGYWRAGFDRLSSWPGAGTTDADYYVSGGLDEVAVYDKALTAAQIRAHADAGYVDRYEREVRADDPAAWWRLNDPDTTARDWTTNGRNGSYYDGAAAVSGQALLERNDDRVASCDGTNDGISFGDVFDRTGTSAFTMEAWVRPTVQDTEYRAIVQKEGAQATGREGYIVWYQSTWGLGFERWSAGTRSIVLPGIPLTLDTWQHVVATYDGTIMRLYLDGAQVGSTPSSLSLINNVQQFRLCDWSGELSGFIDEVAFYTSALSPARVTAHYQAGVGLL